MFRTVVVGLGALILTGCGPGDQTSAAETVTPAAEPEAAAAPVVAADSPPPVGPMSWEAMQDHYQRMEVEPTDAVEALEFRAVLCSHFAGETGSGDPEREQFLGAQMDKYRCEPLVAEVRAMRDARSDEPAVVARLNTVLAGIPY